MDGTEGKSERQEYIEYLCNEIVELELDVDEAQRRLEDKRQELDSMSPTEDELSEAGHI